MKPNRKIDPKEFYSSIRMTMNRKDIMTFVSGLHDIQEAMIEELVRRKEAQGFPEVQEVLKAVKRRL
jgi:spermidine synthase